ncbi:uncharacterized protein LOC106654984 isoform X2 [Trichogramma pretiosum]|uniref:uncharacterized protein LOC106654984 isoform X2 n=1 Tax=Trichogramma pretiosum TaxID=7493 RepID=UPI0006C93DF4|nr:uncharacterized protein LOC106654984 isoform X2 [Trichogramma pretiosum]
MHQSDALGLLRDVATFLSSLGDELELGEALESRRAELLAKSRELLSREPAATSGDSPEPYLDMSIGKSSCASSSIVLGGGGGGGDDGEPTSTIGSNQEYVNADVAAEVQKRQQQQQQQQQRSSLQHYYETFQDLSGMFKSISNNNNNNNNNEKEVAKKNSIGSVRHSDELDDEVSLYAGYTAAQARDKASKCGPLLHLRRERNMFAPFNVFWLNRSCWVCLCGTHLLLFANERGSTRPYLVAPLRGYKSRAAPDAIPRDPRRSEAAFELYCPGDRTFRFSAKSVAEMRDWVETISACLDTNGDDESDSQGRSGFRSRAATFGELLELDATERACMETVKEEKEKYQDVNLPMQLVRSRSKDDSVPEAAAGAPPLPARSQVRRLPSLPSSPLPREDDDDREDGPSEELYDDEGLYHRIEDIRGRDYQNVQPVQRLTKIKVRRAAGASADEANNKAAVGETYDDVHGSIPYDDVKSPSAKESSSKANSSPKPRSPLKRFFSDRMIIGTIGRKDTTKRDVATKSSNSSTKSSTSMPPSPTSRPTPPTCFELPSYDDVSSVLLPSQVVDLDVGNGTAAAVDEENYLCPPPPRPIYSRPATIVKCTTRDDDDDDDDDEEIYDDIGCAQVVINNDSACVDLLRQYPKNSSFLSDLQPSLCDQEHYQVPKSHNRRIIDVVEQQQQQRQEELYDDVSLSENFKNRPRDTPPKPPTTATTTTTTTTSAWSTFSSGKRARVFERDDGNVATTIGGDVADSAAGAPPIAKVKPLQKFINKMENTLSKVNKTSGYA